MGIRFGNAESITKQVAVLGIASYAVGLLTINGYLLRFGVTDFDIVRPRFALVGMITIGITLAYPFAIWAIATQLLAFRQADLLTKLGSSLLCSILSIGPIVLGVRAGVDVRTAFGIPLVSVGFTGLIFVLRQGWFSSGHYTQAGWTGRGPVANKSRRRTAGDKIRPPMINMALIVLLAIFVYGCMIGLVVRDVITIVPTQFGGVEPRSVVVVVKKDSADSLASLSDPDVRLGSGTRATQFRLLYEAQSFILVGTSRGTLWLNKDDIIALYLR